MAKERRRSIRLTDRRAVLRLVAAGALLPPACRWAADPAWAGPDEARALLDRLGQGKAKPGRIQIETAEIAENGRMVPVTLRVASPMTEADHVKRLHLIAERNPAPAVAEFAFTPACGKAEIQVRIRLAESQTIFAVAEASDGSLWLAERAIQVTVGGCTG